MSLLERARAFHEDIETYEMAIIKELEAKPKTNKERVYQQHRVANLLSQAVARSKELDAIYEDKDDSMKQEVAAMRGRDALKNFYDRAKSSWSYHARYPDLPVNTGPNIDEEKEPKVTFSGEELFGKHFDLHDLYARWVNSPQCSDKRLDYGAYLAGLAALGDVPERAKRSKGYAGYVADLEAYLRGFLARTQPLVDADEIVKEAEAEFDKAWEAGRVKGWPRVSKAAPHKAAAPGGGLTARHLDLSLYHAAEDLMPLGLDRLKEALEALGLKCGGTLQQRAERLMAVKGKKPSEIDPKLLAKSTGQKRNGPSSDGPAAKRQNGNGADAGDASDAKANGVPNGKSDGGDWRRSTAAAEARVRAFLEALSDVWEATRKQVDINRRVRRRHCGGEEADANCRGARRRDCRRRGGDAARSWRCGRGRQRRRRPHLQPPQPPPGLGRQADTLLAVQAARPRRGVQVRDLRGLQLLGAARVRQALPGVPARARHAVPRHTQYQALPRHHSYPGRHGPVRQAQGQT
eukprot:TRINITY_DN1167_c0_g1_i3.p1 TRINITY_DN1167_c0_g1~~TRINITY_DN1167_c0_g1_i3.p1  ORF type:complete len:520 (-),score=128.28 TRINITY_DN1167_c0_g1_i3:124-1683(-)